MLDDVPEQTVQTNPYLPVCHTDAASPDEVYPLNDRKLVLYINALQYSVILYYYFCCFIFLPFYLWEFDSLRKFCCLIKENKFLL